jgi:hypothetical protein
MISSAKMFLGARLLVFRMSHPLRRVNDHALAGEFIPRQ